MAAGQGWCAFCNSGMTVDEEFRQALIENRKGFTIDGERKRLVSIDPKRRNMEVMSVRYCPMCGKEL